MEYLRWSEEEVANLRKHRNIHLILLEVDDEGVVTREIGLNETGDIVHAFPTVEDQRGLFDMTPIDLTHVRSNLSSAEFEFHWDRLSLDD
jgi:hypothetical protein